MDSTQRDLVNEIMALLMPHAVERHRSLQGGGRLVHYTNAEAAFKILTGRQIWLRNAAMMNDFSEIQHGISCLNKAWSSSEGLKFQGFLDRIKIGLRDDIAKLFDGHAEAFRRSTFIVSLAEHDNLEDELGRLSMWRAYGGKAGVALILNNTAFLAETDSMKVFSSAVFYRSETEFVDWFQGWASGIVAAEEKIKLFGPDGVRNLIFMAFRSFALCTKHPGFAEEKEWRVYYSPPFEGTSDWIEASIEVIKGAPQQVMKLSLHDDPEKGIAGVAPDALINRVIIGPCEHPVEIRAAICAAMDSAGIQDPMSKLWMSLIPLRDR